MRTKININSAGNENKTFPVLDCSANKINHYTFSAGIVYLVKRQKPLATDRINCKHENGLTLHYNPLLF